MDTAMKLQVSSSLFQFHPFVSTWLHRSGDRYRTSCTASLGSGGRKRLGIDRSPKDRGNENFRGAIGAGSPASPALLRLQPSSGWLAGCYRHWDGRADLEDESHVAVRGSLGHTVFLRVVLLFPKRSNSCPCSLAKFGAVAGCAWSRRFGLI